MAAVQELRRAGAAALGREARVRGRGGPGRFCVCAALRAAPGVEREERRARGSGAGAPRTRAHRGEWTFRARRIRRHRERRIRFIRAGKEWGGGVARRCGVMRWRRPFGSQGKQECRVGGGVGRGVACCVGAGKNARHGGRACATERRADSEKGLRSEDLSYIGGVIMANFKFQE